MARYTGPILKRCRALGIEPQVVGIDKKSRRNPKRNTRKLSDYGMQLREKQKAKFIYGVSEKAFRNLLTNTLYFRFRKITYARVRIYIRILQNFVGTCTTDAVDIR